MAQATRKELVLDALQGAADELVEEGAISDPRVAEAAVKVATRLMQNEYDHEQANAGTPVNNLAKQAVQAQARLLNDSMKRD